MVRDSRLFNAFLFLVQTALILTWWGDVPWINDEPLLIGNALSALKNTEWASTGLIGTMGVGYGPFPSRVYEILLWLSPSLYTVLLIKILLSSTLTLFLLIRLFKKLDLPKSILWLAILSPYLFFYHRLLWDNVFLIPLSLAYFLLALSPTTLNILILGLLSAVLLEIHLLSLFVVAPVLALIAFRFPKKSLLLVIGSIPAILLSQSYWTTLTPSINHSADAHFRVDNLAVFFLGGYWYTFFGFFHRFLPEFKAALGAFFYYLPIPGLLILYWFIRGLIRKLKNRDTNTALFLFPLLAHSLFFIVTSKSHQPHYFNAVWFCYLYFIAVGYKNSPETQKALPFYIGYLAMGVIAFIGWIHTHGGSRHEGYGTTLKNQMEIVSSKIKLAGEKKPIFNGTLYATYPHAYFVLEELELSSGALTPLEKPQVEIRYLHPDNSVDAHLSLMPK